METISLRGVFGASFNSVGIWLEVAKMTVRCACLILKNNVRAKAVMIE